MSLSLEAGEGAESSGETRNASSQGLLTRSSQLITARSSSSPSLTGRGGGGWALDVLLPKAFLLRPWGGLKKAHTQEAKEGGRKHPGPDPGFVPVLWLPSHGAGAKLLHSPKLGVSGTHPRYCIKTCADPREMHAMVFLRLSNAKQMEGGIMTSGASL